MKLELPVTIRAPRPGEMRHRPDIEELLEKRKDANIVEGFVLKQNRTPQLPYRFYATININNSRLWDLFLALSAELPEQVSCTYGLYEEEDLSSNYNLKKKIMDVLSGYKFELTQDCGIELGLVSNTKEQLIELAISESKYVKFYGVDETAFRNHMHDFKLKEIPRLEFIDEYPKIVTPLHTLVKSARSAVQVIKQIDIALNK